MGDESTTNWFYEEPIDAESKKYRLLSNITKAEKMIEAGEIHNAMEFIEDHLMCFYEFVWQYIITCKLYL